MTDLAQEFEGKRRHLRAVAYRMLGSLSEADDAVQEAWLRLSRADAGAVGNLGGWLTTVVSRVCLDMLRARKARREEPVDVSLDATASDGHDAERDALLADSVGVALLTVLETLAPAERVAFVLHDMFDMTFDEIAPIVGRSPVATRQLASRARRRVQGADVVDADLPAQRRVVDAFLAASRNGDFSALLALLDPDVVLQSDRAAAASGAPTEARGADAVAKTFVGRARVAQLATVDGGAALVWAPGGNPRVVFLFVMEEERIVGIEIVAEPDRIREMAVSIEAA